MCQGSLPFVTDRIHTVASSPCRVNPFRFRMEPTTLAGRLLSLRENDLRISQDVLAERLRAAGLRKGATGPSVLRYELGKREPPAEYVRVVAEVAGVDPGWLLTGEGDKHRKPADVSQRAFEEIAAVVDRYRQPLSSDQRDTSLVGRVKGMLHEMVGEGGGVTPTETPAPDDSQRDAELG
jgi:transcriptional regulator with XRE-family HTH domain